MSHDLSVLWKTRPGDAVSLPLPEELTPLCEIMNKYGSDKGNSHNYSKIYHRLFAPFANAPLEFFELGIGTNNPNLPSSMGANGKPGASLRGWRDFLPNTNVYGADVDPNILFEETRISTAFVDQLNEIAIRNLWKLHADRSFDVIIDDGLHKIPAAVSFFLHSFHKLKPGGIYIVEDVAGTHQEFWEGFLGTIRSAVRFASVNAFPCNRKWDDNRLVIIQK